MIRISSIVRSEQGRDKGRYYAVVGMEDDYLLLSDGKHRKMISPKRKKVKHVVYEYESNTSEAVKLREKGKIADYELRAMLNKTLQNPEESREE